MLPLLVVHRYLLYPHLVKLQVSHYMHTLLCWHTCIPRYHPNSYAVLLLHVTLPNPSQNWRQALLVAAILDSAIRPASCCHSFTTMVVSIYHGKEHIWSWHHCNHSQLSLHPAYTHFFTPQFNASPNHTSSPPPFSMHNSFPLVHSHPPPATSLLHWGTLPSTPLAIWCLPIWVAACYSHTWLWQLVSPTTHRCCTIPFYHKTNCHLLR